MSRTVSGLATTLADIRRDLKCLARTVCELESGGNTETDPIFSASPSFGITSTNITDWNTAATNSHTHTNKLVLDGITNTKVSNWDSAYTTTQSLSTTYFPLIGGNLTGTAGAGFVGFPVQTSNPTTPASGFRLFSNNSSQLSWKDTGGFVRSFIGTITADKTYTLPDTTGTIALLERAQTFTQATTFSTTITSATIIPNANGTRTLGNSSTQYQTTYTQNVLGTSLLLSTVGSTNMTFGINSGATIAGTLFSNGNWVFQNGGTQTNAGFLLDVTGTTRLNGNVTLGGSIIPDGDNTRSLGSNTLRWGTLYTINVAKGNAGNSMNLVVTGSSDIFLRVQQTTNNVYVQSSGPAPAETNYKFTVNGTGATVGALLVTNGNVSLPLVTYADNAAAISGGLVANMLYKLADGSVKIVV